MAFRNLELASLPAIFWKGAITLLPLAVTLYGFVWIVMTLESMLRNLVPDAMYVPGIGLLRALLFILLFGALMHLFLFERIVDYGSKLLNRIPVVKSIYSALQDFVKYLGPSGAENLSLVVLVTIGENVRLIGFVTNPHVRLPCETQASSQAMISVYLLMSYQIGGYMVLVPAASVEALDLSVEQAMHLVLTAGVTSPQT
jgi:uncharacterized membrane protein